MFIEIRVEIFLQFKVISLDEKMGNLVKSPLENWVNFLVVKHVFHKEEDELIY